MCRFSESRRMTTALRGIGAAAESRFTVASLRTLLRFASRHPGLVYLRIRRSSMPGKTAHPFSDTHDAIRNLSNPDGTIRRAAREAAVQAGDSAVPGLIAALSSENGDARWEAAKA